jgi:hypothetical protein
MRSVASAIRRCFDANTGTERHSDVDPDRLFRRQNSSEQARRIAATLSHVYLVEMPNEGHDARPGPCHTAIVTQFFDDPTRRPDTSCVATIAPTPFVTTWEPAKAP